MCLSRCGMHRGGVMGAFRETAGDGGSAGSEFGLWALTVELFNIIVLY